jgi:hypothetical protein
MDPKSVKDKEVHFFQYYKDAKAWADEFGSEANKELVQMMKEKLLTGQYRIAISAEEESYPEVMDILKKFMI